MVQLLILFSALFFSLCLAEKEGNRYHQVISWEPPLDSNDFRNWRFHESSVPLQNKIILTPNGKDQLGFIANLWTFTATSWEMSLDFDVDFKSEMSEGSKAEWQIYFLEHVPDAMGRGQYSDFGRGLLGDQLKGFEIRVAQVTKPKKG